MSAFPFSNDQPIIAGQKIGVSPVFAALLWVIIIGLSMMNIYHIDNFLVSKLTNENTSWIFIFTLHIIAVSASLLEVPLAKSIVTSYRLHGMNSTVFLQGVFTLIIASMAVVGGINSQLSDADKRDSSISSYETTLGNFDTQKESLQRARTTQKAMAGMILDTNSREVAKLKADQDYYTALAKLQANKAGHQMSRPIRALETGSTLHWVTITLFSLVCSFGVIFASGFMAVYYRNLVSLPAFSLMSKANHEWSSDKDSFVAQKSGIDLLNGTAEGYARVEKPQPEKPNQNRPAPADTTAGAVSESKKHVSERSPNPPTKKGAKVDYSGVHYETLLRAVIVGEVNPTQKPMKAALMSFNIKFVDDAARQKKAIEILNTMAEEGVLILNPDYKKGGKVVAQYKLNPEFLNKFEVREDAYWDYVSERLDAGQHVEALLGEDPTSSRKPQGMIDYDARLLVSALNAPATTEKVNGGTITRSGHMMSFMPDWLGDDDHPDNPMGERVKGKCPQCDSKGNILRSRLLEGSLVECKNGHTYDIIENEVKS